MSSKKPQRPPSPKKPEPPAGAEDKKPAPQSKNEEIQKPVIQQTIAEEE